PRSGDRAAQGMPRPRFMAPASRYGVAPSEGTAPPFAVAPFRVVAPCPAPPKTVHFTPSNYRI
ncbi:MAG: hypothetical protein ABI727_07840, partial [Nitrosospira sp.]